MFKEIIQHLKKSRLLLLKIVIYGKKKFQIFIEINFTFLYKYLTLLKKISLPATVVISSIVVLIFISFFTFEKAYFIYDPYTLETSGLTIEKMKKKAYRERVLLEAVEMPGSDYSFLHLQDTFSSIYKSGRKVITTSFLYGVAAEKEGITGYLYGPLFDYSDTFLGVAVETITGKENLKQIFENNVEKIIIYRDNDNDCPEKYLIDFLKNAFLEKKPNGKILYNIIEAFGMENQEENTLYILAARTLNWGLAEKISKYEGKTVVFDFINGDKMTRFLFEKKYVFSYNYTMSIKEIFADIKKGRKSENLHYLPIFSLIHPM